MAKIHTRKPDGMNEETMGRIAEDLNVMRAALQAGKPVDHHRRQYAGIVMVLAFVSAATQAAQQAFTQWDELDAGTLDAECRAKEE